ncbi:GntR family transcriptional regulator [Fusibacter bizertensis]
MKLNRKLHIPLYIQLKDQILVNIKSDDYIIGDMIQSEQELMKTFQVGRATVREAINELVKEGFLEKQQGRGTFIKRKETSLGFEPLLSLSYSLKMRGWEHKNQVIIRKQIENTVAETLIKAPKIFYFERNRTIDGHPLGFEKFYFQPDFEMLVSEYNLENSIGKLILEILKLPIERLIQEVIIVKANEQEANLLKLNVGDDLMFMKRWLYVKGFEGAYQYYEFKVPVGVSAFPADLL